jgi:hypothetical protein
MPLLCPLVGRIIPNPSYVETDRRDRYMRAGDDGDSLDGNDGTSGAPGTLGDNRSQLATARGFDVRFQLVCHPVDIVGCYLQPLL